MEHNGHEYFITSAGDICTNDYVWTKYYTIQNAIKTAKNWLEEGV